MRLIDADALKEKSYRTEFAVQVVDVEDIDNAPTVKDRFHEGYTQGFVDGKISEETNSGIWIYKEYDFICSNCNGLALDLNDYPYLSTYCPNCGAKMEVNHDIK